MLAYETGVTNTVDPLGGSYFVEAMTKQMERQARVYFDRIEELGGMIPALESGFFRREIADAAFQYQREVDAKRKLIVGVNAFQEADEKPLETLVIDDKGGERTGGPAARAEGEARRRGGAAVAGRGAARGGDEGEPAADADRGGAGAARWARSWRRWRRCSAATRGARW